MRARDGVRARLLLRHAVQQIAQRRAVPGRAAVHRVDLFQQPLDRPQSDALSNLPVRFATSILNTSPVFISAGSFCDASATTTSGEFAVRQVTGLSTARGKSC